MNHSKICQMWDKEGPWFHVCSVGIGARSLFQGAYLFSLCEVTLYPHNWRICFLDITFIFLVVEGSMKSLSLQMQLLHVMRCMLSCKIKLILTFWSNVSSRHNYPLGDLVKRLGPVGAMPFSVLSAMHLGSIILLFEVMFCTNHILTFQLLCIF